MAQDNLADNVTIATATRMTRSRRVTYFVLVISCQTR